MQNALFNYLGKFIHIALKFIFYLKVPTVIVKGFILYKVAFIIL